MKYKIYTKHLIKKISFQASREIIITDSKMFGILSKHKIYQLSLSPLSLSNDLIKNNPYTLYRTCIASSIPIGAMEDLCKTYHWGTQ